MGTYNKTFLRAARLICRQLANSAGKLNPIILPAEQWRSVTQLARSVEIAHYRGWRYAAMCRQNELIAQLDYLQNSLAQLSDRFRGRPIVRPFATEAELYFDFVALQREFASVECDFEDSVIAVTTQAIHLEGIELGPFQIRLDWQSLSEYGAYRVVALEPRPAATNSEITHPHVSEETLCEGDGQRAIRSALAGGRLLDFFTIVDRTLHTYAPGRAYVELDKWDGITCHDCGSLADEDERYSCDHCEETICPDCGSSCNHCDRFCCGGCSTNCRRCGETTCTACLRRCPSCGHQVCPNCFLPDSNHCTQCHEELIDELEPDSENPPADEAGSEVHAHGVGQAPIPA